jgi:hypothetical protein
MPSTVYKGDIAEVSFAPETGLVIRGVTDATMQLSNSDDITTITFTAEQNTTLFEASGFKLKYPKNMLVGSQVVWEKGSSTAVLDADLPNSGTGGKTFTIVENSGATIKITPAMTTSALGTVNLASGNNLHILPYKTPPIDVSATEAATGAGNGGTESCKIDQFLGIASAITLPETKVDLKRFHVVGLGRDTSIQVPGKMITEGGSFEVNMHTARWLKYCLGNELLEIANDDTIGSGFELSGIHNAGASVVDLNNSTSLIAVGDYIDIRDEGGDSVPIVSDHEPDAGDWDGTFTLAKFDTAKPHECRRIIGKSETGNRLYLDEPLKYRHASTTPVKIRRYGSSNSITISSNTITNPATHLLFSRSTLPSFCIEVSQRRRDLDSDESATDGGVGDTKELTRVYRGCKVSDFSMTVDNDAALKLSVNFNSALCYTDTGRLENTPLTRYGAHRMFDDTANTDLKRLESGIGVGTQKPFMFYNGSVQLGGVQVAQVFTFTLTGTTGVVSHHTIAGSSQAAGSGLTDQVPFAGSRNANLMVEGQTTYEMTMEIAVDDPIFFHKMRTGAEFSTNVDGTGANRVLIEFEKNRIGSTSAGNSEKMLLIIDDFYITEAPIQIPEDKGVVKSAMKIMAKAVKVIARDTLHKY